MDIKITRFVPYEGNRGNAVALADAIVNTDNEPLEFYDLKLYETTQGLKLSEKQLYDEDLRTWVKREPLIPSEVYEPLRETLVSRYHGEVVGQMQLI